MAARVATHCCFAAASPHHGFSRARYYPHAPPRARSTPTCAPAKLRSTSRAIYLSTYPTLSYPYWPPHPRDLHTTCSLPEASLATAPSPCFPCAGSGENGKSTRNRIRRLRFRVILRNIRIENFDIYRNVNLLTHISKCDKTPMRETGSHRRQKTKSFVVSSRIILLKNELFLVNISRREEIKGLENFCKSM